jgi:hypothetical protein
MDFLKLSPVSYYFDFFFINYTNIIFGPFLKYFIFMFDLVKLARMNNCYLALFFCDCFRYLVSN